MKRWILLAVLAVMVASSGCQSMTRVPEKKKTEPTNEVKVPSGELAPFAN